MTGTKRWPLILREAYGAGLKLASVTEDLNSWRFEFWVPGIEDPVDSEYCHNPGEALAVGAFRAMRARARLLAARVSEIRLHSVNGGG